MLAHARFPRQLAITLIALAGGVCGRAQLATSSPFLPSGTSGVSTAPTAGAPLEFRGLVDTPTEELKVRIYDPNRKIGAWLRVNERNPNFDFVVKQYDASRDTTTVEYHGQTLVLAMHEGKVISSGAAVPNIPVAQVQSPIMGGSVGAPNTTNATPANQTQLEAVAAAVAQRRALREQAAQQANQGVSVAPQVIQPPQPQQRPSANPPQNPNNQQRSQRATGGR